MSYTTRFKAKRDSKRLSLPIYPSLVEASNNLSSSIKPAIEYYDLRIQDHDFREIDRYGRVYT